MNNQIKNPLHSKILELVGEASMCWTTPDQVFDSTAANIVAGKIYQLLVQTAQDSFLDARAQLQEQHPYEPDKLAPCVKSCGCPMLKYYTLLDWSREKWKS